MASALSAPHLQNEDAAFAYVEARLWPNGPICPHCGANDRISKMQGQSTRKGLYKCYHCRKPFTVRMGTIFESSKIPLNVWLQAFFLMAGSKKGISSNQLSRTLGVTVKTAWFLSHRIREAMRSGETDMFGSDGGLVEVDETFIGKSAGAVSRGGYAHKMKILTLIDRNSGRARSVKIENVSRVEIEPILRANIAPEAHLMTDEHGVYKGLRIPFAAHDRVFHGVGEYARGKDIHTNTIEGFFSIFKRGMKGVYQHCREKHLHRYLAEFDFRYSNRVALGCDDLERADRMLRGVVGRRLKYA